MPVRRYACQQPQCRPQPHTRPTSWLSACPTLPAQLNVFLAMSQALRTMSLAQWPGFTDQGFWVITDLTQPVVVLGSQALLSGAYCPYGFAGFLMPAALLYMYRKTVQELPLGEGGGRDEGRAATRRVDVKVGAALAADSCPLQASQVVCVYIAHAPVHTCGQLSLPVGGAHPLTPPTPLLPLPVACHATAAQRSPLFSAALDVPMLAILWSSTVSVPQATLLYWLSNSAFFMGLQKALAEPRIAAALRLPAVMMPHPRHDKEARGKDGRVVRCVQGLPLAQQSTTYDDSRYTHALQLAFPGCCVVACTVCGHGTLLMCAVAPCAGCVCPAERAELEALRAQQLVCGSEDVGFLRYLAASYVSRGMHQQALQCLQRLTMLSPGVWRVCVLDSLLAHLLARCCCCKHTVYTRLYYQSGGSASDSSVTA